MSNVKNNAAAQLTKRKLLEAAGEIFAEQGYERATIKDITDRAGVAIAAVNYHFSDKQELYYQVVKSIHRAGMEAAAVITNPDPATSPADQLLEHVRTFLRNALDPARPAWYVTIMIREMREPGTATERLMEETFRPYSRALEDLVSKLIGRRISHRKTLLIVESIISQYIFFTDYQKKLDRFHAELPPIARRIDEIADHITEFSLAAIRGLYACPR
jgi:AcrR family transcriptional regulator